MNALLVFASGCFMHNSSPTKQLKDSVHEMNKATRWGSLGMAVRMVEPSYQERFTRTHQHWGQAVQVADTDIVQLEISPDGRNAVATIAYQWYRPAVMRLHRTMVRQRWSRHDGRYALAAETVVGGDGRLLQGKPPGENATPAPMDPMSTSLTHPR